VHASWRHEHTRRWQLLLLLLWVHHAWWQGWHALLSAREGPPWAPCHWMLQVLLVRVQETCRRHPRHHRWPTRYPVLLLLLLLPSCAAVWSA
jgi:hypothetical protein